MEANNLFEDVYDKRFMKAMEHFDVDCYEEVLLYTPSDYVDLSKPPVSLSTALKNSLEGNKSLCKLKLRGAPELMAENGSPLSLNSASKSKGTHRLKIKYTDGNSIGTTMFFGRAGGGNLDEWAKLSNGSSFYVYSNFDNSWNGVIALQDPSLIKDSELGKIKPIYTGKEKIINPNRIELKISSGLLSFVNETVEFICHKLNKSESEIISSIDLGFKSLKDIILAIHKPKNTEEVEKSKHAVKMLNAMLAYQLSQEHKELDCNNDSAMGIDIKGIVPDLVSRLPFQITQDQRISIWETLQDLNSSKPMRRLVSGDVGTGKTVCYMIPAVAAQKSGKNVVIMTPNSLLTDQIAKEIKTLFPEVPLVEIQGGQKEKEKVDIPNNSIVIGTTAILWRFREGYADNFKVDFYILDEQQKLGKEQKEELLDSHTNFLEATATAIPRTIALVKYSDMKVSRIVTCPVKKVIHSHIIGSDSKGEAFNKIKAAISGGGQAAILYPRRTREFSIYEYRVLREDNCDSLPNAIEYIMDKEKDKVEIDYDPENKVISIETTEVVNKRIKSLFANAKTLDIEYLRETSPSDEEAEAKKSVEEAYKKWSQAFPNRVAMLHGKTPKNEKFEILEKIKNKEVDILITSTVIEIGLTLPSLNFVMVVGADKLGASTLHQIRGRLVRHGGEGDFYMYVDRPYEKISESSFDRLLNVKDNLNGFDIAENDMQQRGFGDIGKLGSKQSGFSKGLFCGSKTSPADIDFYLEHKN